MNPDKTGQPSPTSTLEALTDICGGGKKGGNSQLPMLIERFTRLFCPIRSVAVRQGARVSMDAVGEILLTPR